MPSSPSTLQIPPTFGRARITVLLACLLAALSAGTNYVRLVFFDTIFRKDSASFI
ncbi:hypothetical protein GYMLUDRAFT_71148 [Collybiopsis luxurians FD-317 M1]|nr:hypothetical protein GYMLUDRAFT_71148 [Collybiopsis luxurians FD-317 M1]